METNIRPAPQAQTSTKTRSRVTLVVALGVAVGGGWIAFALIYRFVLQPKVTLTAVGCAVVQNDVRCSVTAKRWLVFTASASSGKNAAGRVTAEGLPPTATFAADGRGGYTFAWLPNVRPEKAPAIKLQAISGTKTATYNVVLTWN